jgi:hypothetical protein
VVDAQRQRYTKHEKRAGASHEKGCTAQELHIAFVEHNGQFDFPANQFSSDHAMKVQNR